MINTGNYGNLSKGLHFCNIITCAARRYEVTDGGGRGAGPLSFGGRVIVKADP